MIGLYEYLACFCIFFHSCYILLIICLPPNQLPRVNKSGCKLDTQLIASQITPGLGGNTTPNTQQRGLTRAGIFKQSMGARNRVGMGLSYRPARLHRLAESIPRNRFLGSLNVYKYGLSPRRSEIGRSSVENAQQPNHQVVQLTTQKNKKRCQIYFK